jgi:predicted permease
MGSAIKQLLARLLGMFRRRRGDEQLAEEIRAHLDLLIDDHVRRGLPPAEAHAAAHRDFGGVDQIKEQYRDQRGWVFLDAIRQDVRYAFRTYGKNRSFAAVAILMLAVGIGANTAIFTLIDSLILRWLPVARPQQLVQIKILRRDLPPAESFSYPVTRGLSDAMHDVFSGLFGSATTSFVVGPAEAPTRARGAWVTGAYYDTLGVRAARGRLLTRADDQPGAPPAVVITESYWARVFDRDPDIVGRLLVIEGVQVPIVGVSAGPFGGVDVGEGADLTLAVAAVPQLVPDQSMLLETSTTWLHILARPREGESRSQAQAALALAWPRVVEQVGVSSDAAVRRRTVGTGLQVVSGGTGWTFLRDQFEDPLFVLMALVGLVHLLGCANVANLMLARASVRRREIAIRLAIGAGRGRIVRQMLVESLILSMAGAAAGTGLAWFVERHLVDMLSAGRRSPIVIDLTPHWHVLAFTVVTAVMTGAVFGLAPAWHAIRSRSAPALTTVATTGTRRSGLAASLVIAEVALSLLMLVGAGLFIQTLQRLRALDAGFSRDGVLLADLDVSRNANGPQLSALFDDLTRDVARLPGVTTTSLSLITPLVGGGINQPVKLNGQPVGDPSPYFNAIGPQYFAALGTRLIEGREFLPGDSTGGPVVAIVNRAFVRRYLGARPALGQRLAVRIVSGDAVIVGVVQDAAYETLREPPPPTVYMPLAQVVGPRRVGNGITLIVGVAGSTGSTAGTLEQSLQRRFPGAPVRVRTLSGQIDRSLIRERLMASLAGTLGVVALILAGIGVFGLLAYTVASRTNEIGVRIALGAARNRILWLVISDGIRLVTIGAAIGLPVAWAASRLISSLLFGVKATDALTMIGAVTLLLTAGVVAAALPAHRAIRVEPVVAIRHE